MKTYQFVGFAVVGLIIAAALLVGKRKKPCGCGGHGALPPIPVESIAVVTDGE